MKKFLGTISCAMLTIISMAQPVKFTVNGVLTDAKTKSPIEGAQIKLGNTSTLSNGGGDFSLGKLSPGNYLLSVNSLGYKIYESELVVGNKPIQLTIPLISNPLFLQPLEVHAIRAAYSAPFAKTNISKDQLEANNLGQDLPMLLNQTPSVVVNSDAGNGVGYTGIRIRGSDATRVNVTLNGIPYNDAESMGVYFVDLPDLASSVNNIQIQRGVGTSTNGASAFGATVNISTNEYNEKAYVAFNNSFGSFNTFKNTLKAGTGLLSNHFTIDARLSNISSDGYIDRASSSLQSYYFSAAYINQKTSLRFNNFTGKEKTYQAWYGVPESMLSTNRTYNPAGMEKPGTPYDNQTDNYTQTHYQLFLNHALSETWSFNTALFLTKGKGYYEEYKADQEFAKYGLPNPIIAGIPVTTTDLIRQRWLDNSYLGQIASFQYKKDANDLNIGGGWSVYQGQHFGNITWMEKGTVSPDYRYYNYPATKKDANIYAKWQHKINEHWLSFIDLQYRQVSHHMEGFQGSSSLTVDRKLDFFNPKAGITYSNQGWQAFFSYARGNKEPNRDDFQASPTSQPKPETMNDFELGIEKKQGLFHYGATLYWMQYKDQLVLTGQINDVGSYTRTNVPESYRLGLELQASNRFAKWLQLGGNLTISKNKIKSYTEYIDNWDNGLQNTKAHENTDIAFSPALIGAITTDIQLTKNWGLTLLSKYVGKQYLDNSQNDKRKLGAYFTQDLRMNYSLQTKWFKEVRIIGQVNNLFNAKYQPNGYTYNYVFNNELNSDNGYYPQAETNFVFALNIRL